MNWRLATALSMALLAGCADSKNGSGTAVSDNTKAPPAIVCKQCEVTFVRNADSKTIAYSAHKEMECWDCRTVAENYFATGKTEHACASCNSKMQACEAH